MTTDGLLKVSANVVRDNDVTDVVVITDLTPNGNSKWTPSMLYTSYNNILFSDTRY